MNQCIYLLLITAMLLPGCKGSETELKAKTNGPGTDQAAAAVEDLPVCTVEKIESCDVDEEHPTQTVYTCPHCGVNSKAACRCRLEKTGEKMLRPTPPHSD